MKTNLLCPLKVAGYIANSNEDLAANTECSEHKCAWWINSYTTTEDIYVREGMCAIKFNAQKNSEGKIPV